MPAVNYLWNPINDNIIAEYDDNGNVIVEYTTEPGYHGAVISEHRNGQTYYHHHDGQGNLRALTNDQGEVTDTFAYTANGEVTERTGTTPTPFRYGGEHGYYTDLETGEVMVRRRTLSPTLGRWLSMDPLKFAGQINFFEYVFNCPTMFLDPSGLQAEDLPKELPGITPFPVPDRDKTDVANCVDFYNKVLRTHPAAVKCYQDYLKRIGELKDPLARSHCKRLSFTCLCCPSHAAFKAGFIILCANTPSIRDKKADGTAQAICHEIIHALQFAPCKEGGPLEKDLKCLERLKLEFQAYLCAGQCLKEGGGEIDPMKCAQSAVASSKNSAGCKELSEDEIRRVVDDFQKWIFDVFPKLDLDKFCPIQYQPPKKK